MGNVVSCGPTAMEMAVMSKGGRPSCSTVLSDQQLPINNTHSTRLITLAYMNNNRSLSTAAQSESGRSSVSNMSHGTFAMGHNTPATSDGTHTFVDEEYLRCLQSHMGWDRESGIIHLMPIAVVYQEDL